MTIWTQNTRRPKNDGNSKRINCLLLILKKRHITFPGLLMVLIGFFMRQLKNRLKTARILLEKPFHNHRKNWAVFERFFKQDLSGLSSFSKKNRPNRTYLAAKPLNPLKSWAVFERDLDPGYLMHD